MTVPEVMRTELYWYEINRSEFYARLGHAMVLSLALHKQIFHEENSGHSVGLVAPSD